MQMIGTCFLIAFYLKMYGLEETLIVAALGTAACIMFADCKKIADMLYARDGDDEDEIN